MDGWKNLLQSKTVWGVVAMLVGTALQQAGYVVTDADTTALADGVGAVVAAVGALYALFGRVKATKQIGKDPNAVS